MNDRQPFAWGWVWAGALLLPLLYVPTLATRFDFIDDGNLVYPAPPQPLGARLALVGQKIVANYEHLGPFRPVLWVHWELAAEWCAGQDWRWRLLRLLWCGGATGALLWLLRELRLHPLAALGAAAVAMWNPYRNEIWTSLTLAEGVAMPYALAALACAVRGHFSSRAWRWDCAAMLCVLAALGCKNTFVALIPVQMLLRLAPTGTDWLVNLRTHGGRAGLLLLPALMPLTHFIYFKLHWKPGQYVPGAPSVEQFGRLLNGLRGALSLDFLAPGLLLALIACAVTRVRWAPYRGPLLAGGLLLLTGVGVYLPMTMLAGRYTMPAVWGADLLLAVVLSALLTVPILAWRRVAGTAFVLGLGAVAVANVGKQEKFAARAAMLWHALETVERTAAPHAVVAWVGRPDTGKATGPVLNLEEGIHFLWHLHARGRTDLRLFLFDERGQPVLRAEVPSTCTQHDVVVQAADTPPPFPTEWDEPQIIDTPYWHAHQRYHCTIWHAQREQ
jgi:hypothetical protein